MTNTKTNCRCGCQASPVDTCARRNRVFNLLLDHFEAHGIADGVDVLGTLVSSMFPNSFEGHPEDSPQWSMEFIRDATFTVNGINTLMAKLYQEVRNDLYNRQNVEI